MRHILTPYSSSRSFYEAVTLLKKCMKRRRQRIVIDLVTLTKISVREMGQRSLLLNIHCTIGRVLRKTKHSLSTGHIHHKPYPNNQVNRIIRRQSQRPKNDLKIGTNET
jgi:hypothetical protein